MKFEQKRVNDEVWLPTHIEIHGNARIAYMKKLRLEIELTYRDYRKFQTDSKIVDDRRKVGTRPQPQAPLVRAGVKSDPAIENITGSSS